MKKISLSLLILPSILLTSCIIIRKPKETYAKEIEVYDIDKLDNEKNLSSGFQKKITARFVEDQDLIPYVTLEQYASLYRPHFKDDIGSFVMYGTRTDTWTISASRQAYFYCEIDHTSGLIRFVGSISNAYDENDDPRDLVALNYGLKTEGDAKVLSNTGYASLSFSGYQNISHFTYHEQHYYPLGLLDTAFSNNSSIYFTYNYKHIYSTRDVENYENCSFIEDNKTTTFDEQMENNSSSQAIPSYLAKYNADLFLFLMDNLYGLKDKKGISSFTSYYRNQYGIYDKLTSSDNLERGFAYSDALSVLDDNHTLLVGANDTWGEKACGRYRRYGEGCHRRSEIATALKQYRSELLPNYEVGKDILYSEDEKTAFFTLNGFAYGSSEQVFNSDGSIKDTAGDYDSFFYMSSTFKTIKNKGGVEDVIIDISTNGGGVVGILLKILCLISKDNTADFCMYDDLSTIAYDYLCRVDSNGDGEYNTEDCFGDDFNIYLLTSDYSFSCGNALPCIAKLSGDVKTIGQKSGGGECAVAIHYLPNSEYVYHSSNLHLGYLDRAENKFVGFEDGVKPDIEIPALRDFYSIELLANSIKNSK